MCSQIFDGMSNDFYITVNKCAQEGERESRRCEDGDVSDDKMIDFNKL